MEWEQEDGLFANPMQITSFADPVEITMVTVPPRRSVMQRERARLWDPK